MKKKTIVSLADSNYFPLLDELIDSIKRFKESKDTAICVLDAGLSEEQKSLEKLLVQKFDELFLYSQSQVFDTACFESKELSKSFVGFTNVFGENNDIYQSNLSKDILNKKSKVKNKLRKENIVKDANERQNSKRRRCF